MFGILDYVYSYFYSVPDKPTIVDDKISSVIETCNKKYGWKN